MNKMNKEGFSLIEMVIAMAITAIVMAGVLSLIAYTTRSMSITQARAALQDEAKDSVNHISVHAMEGMHVITPYNPDLADYPNDASRDITRDILLIQKVDQTGGTEVSSWYLYWRAGGVEAGDSDMLCYAPLEILGQEVREEGVDSSLEMPDDFDMMTRADQLTYISSLTTAVELGGLQKRHLLCENVINFDCNVDTLIKTETRPLKIILSLKDERSEFECVKDISLRNQERR